MTSSWIQHQTSLLVFLLVLLLIALSNLRVLRRLGEWSLPSHFPRVSLLVPARDEEENIRPCLASLLGQKYPDFEVLALDDDSSDDTGQLISGVPLSRDSAADGEHCGAVNGTFGQRSGDLEATEPWSAEDAMVAVGFVHQPVAPGPQGEPGGVVH